MTRKRRIPAGALPEDLRARGRTMENEVLARLLGPGRAPLDWLMKRYPALTQEQAEATLAQCRAILEEGYSLVSDGLRARGETIQAMGQLSQAHPWIDVHNLEAIIRQGTLYAR
jgi:hypothetical protein